MTPRIALATCRDVPELLDDDARTLQHALIARGATCEPAVWDDEHVDWAGYDLVVVRCTWDYPTRLEEFLAWARRVPRLANDAATLAWNTDKHYLARLAEAGVPVVPSAFLEPDGGGTGALDRHRHPFDDVEHVVKPAVSAGSRDTLRLGPGEGHDHVRALLDAGRSVLVQPYLDAVDEHGETAIVSIEGSVSHALRKAALLERGAGLVDGLFAPEDMSAREASPIERDLAARVLGMLDAPLYARVDLLPSPVGPLVLEVELTEPSLFLPFAPGAAERLADAIVRRAGRTR